MVSLIKNQILKHLSRYTKNLSADKINLSTFKGEGELTSLELDEIVLTDLLELPSWLRLTSAWCNKVTFRIQWTKLKSVPIHLSLDEVHINIETCEELRSMSAHQPLSSLGAATKYNFINKVIDGMTICVNMVKVKFKSPAFTASVQILRIVVQSKTPDWKKGDLRLTKLKEPKKGQILIFKELEWQTVRIEASSIQDSELPPLRLLTNFTRCRITIKKRLSDCFVMGCRLALLLDDLLWVLTDSQLKAALCFIDSLSGLVKKDTEVTRTKKAARKLEVLPEYQAQLAQQARVTEPRDTMCDIFARYDFIETSYHFFCAKIDLHLSEDPGTGRSCHPDLQVGGAFQINLHNFQVDYYPYHLATGDRHHWAKYKEGNSPHSQWLNQAHSVFRNTLLQLVDIGHHMAHPAQDSRPSPSQNPVKAYVLSQLAKLMTACVIIRIEDFTLYRVSTSAKKQQQKEFVKGDKERHAIPSVPELMTLHAEFTYYYYPGDEPFPLPPPKFYVHVNPVQIHFDVLTLLWLNSFALSLQKPLLSAASNAAGADKDAASLSYIDVKVEAIMPRLVLESVGEQLGQKDRPRSLHFNVSRASITNVRSVERCSRADLAKCVHAYQLGSLFYNTDFPSKPDDLAVLTDKFLSHVQCTDNVRPEPSPIPSDSIEQAMLHLHRELLWTEAKDVWCVLLEPVWGEFYGMRAVGNSRPVPFFDAFPLTLWAHVGPPSAPDIRALAHVSNLVSVQLNHYQFLFLLRIADDLTELTTFLAMDSDRIASRDSRPTVVVGALVPQLEVTFVMPAQCPGKESSGGDLESVIPDSSSIADDAGTTTSVQWNTVLSTNMQDGGVYKRHPTLTSPTSDILSDNASLSIGRSEPQPRKSGGKKVELSFQFNSSHAHFQKAQPVSNHVEKKISEDKYTLVEPQSGPALPVKDFTQKMKGFGVGLGNMISNPFDKLKPSTADDASDSMSVRSDASSDSDNYVAFKMKDLDTGDTMFSLGDGGTGGVELANDALEDDEATLTTPSHSETSHSIASSYKRRDLVAVATFKLGQVEVMQQSEGFNSSVKLQIFNISAEECPSIPWDEFQSKFTMRSRGWSEMSSTNHKPRVTARLNHTVTPQSPAQWVGPGLGSGAWFTNLLTVRVANTELGLSVATIAGLADLAEDEVLSTPLPVDITLENIRLHLTEDRSCNITSPGPIPLDVNISQLRVHRTEDGVLHVEPPPPPSPLTPTTPHTPAMDQVMLARLRSENDELRRRLAAMEKINEENHVLRRCQEETKVLRSLVNSAQEDLCRALEAKQELLDKVQRLQAAANSNDKQQSNTKR
ncbi:bridge-like lipid transfer protein family member 3B isoform X2 [Macrosteles quadrilineatus]|uniref:bridge-like lipid transfer protein family member 3B isoform X2 n=1 Tax=Macrosteles quadrilineatus TaxID=74068 RepID=UPI0023E1C644|nr:bridge-like lipid transfer protein family member 3B isoform X2 [Macrosteles quadrilineatus]